MQWSGRHAVLVLGVAQAIVTSNAYAGVQVTLTGATSVVPGQIFEVDLVVPQPGTPFNGYDATISWDPSRLTFLAAVPLRAQEGSYMTEACGSTYHSFRQYATNVQIGHVIWCAGMSLPGPGQLYRLKFQALTTPGTTQVTIAADQFYNAGNVIPTTSASPATIVIASPSDVASTASAVRLEAAPNPFRPVTTLLLQAPEAGRQRICVHDVAGRLVRTVDDGVYAAGLRQVRWDGKDNHGRRLASGTYWVTLETGTTSATTRVVLLR